LIPRADRRRVPIGCHWRGCDRACRPVSVAPCGRPRSVGNRNGLP